jgi:hypothetical protein
VTHEPDVEIRRVSDSMEMMVSAYCRYCGAILRHRLETATGPWSQWVRPPQDQCWGRTATAAAEEHGLD